MTRIPNSDTRFEITVTHYRCSAMFRRPCTWLPAAAIAGTLAAGCLRPPAKSLKAESNANPKAAFDWRAGDVSGFYDPTWGDSGGKDGNGGVKLFVNDTKKLPLRKGDFSRPVQGDAATRARPDWQLFVGPDGRSLAFDLTWITKETDKFYGLAWAGGGIAFNSSWVVVDAEDARYLVLWAKANTPGVDLKVGLHSTSKRKGQEDTGKVSLSQFASGKRLDQTWRRITIPLSAFPDVHRVDLRSLQQLTLEAQGPYPENERVTIYLDNLYLSNVEMVTPVTNLGYVVRDDGVEVVWEKDWSEPVREFRISVDGKRALTVDGKARSVLLPGSLTGSKSRPIVVGVASVGSRETSDEQRVKLVSKPSVTIPVTVTLGEARHEISPYIWGTNFGSTSAVKDLGVTVRRWGGNRATKYNWKFDVDSAGADWFFLNDYAKPEGTPEGKKRYHEFIKETLDGGADVNFCVPISDWIAKPHPDEKLRYCSYPISEYPAQEKSDGQGCGNGRRPNGDPIWDNDPSLAMVRNSPELQREFVQTVVGTFGTAEKGGVKFYSMDNEPGLWMQTHRDTMARGISAERLADLNTTYAGVVKAVDPSAKVIGFGAWGMLELAGSNEDYLPAGPDGFKRQKENVSEADKFREKKRHGGDSQLVYLLKRFKQAEAQQGKRLVDVIDIHWYPELYGRDSHGVEHRVMDDVPYDDTFAELQWEALREWWDPTFRLSEQLHSWAAGENTGTLWGPYHPVIPALKRTIESTYPGTKLAINEYDNGSPEQYHGALLRAASLGIFMQEDLYMAQNWHQTDDTKFVYWAQKLYGNYDGRGSRVNGKFVVSQSSHPDLLTFAAMAPKRWMVILINKNHHQRMSVALEIPGNVTVGHSYTLAESLGLRLLESPLKVEGRRVPVTVPPYAAMLVEAK